MLEVERRRTTGSGSRPLYRFAAIGEIPCYAIKCFTDSGGGARGLRPSSSLLIIKSRPTIMLCSHKAVATRNAKYAIRQRFCRPMSLSLSVCVFAYFKNHL